MLKKYDFTECFTVNVIPEYKNQFKFLFSKKCDELVITSYFIKNV